MIYQMAWRQDTPTYFPEVNPRYEPPRMDLSRYYQGNISFELPDMETEILVTEHDVLCGRGAPNLHHPGNQYFRSLVRAHQKEYSLIPRRDKAVLVERILSDIRERGGRFLRQQQSPRIWMEVHQAIAYEKVCQALREYKKTRNKTLDEKHK
jgi:hypothetical protein